MMAVENENMTVLFINSEIVKQGKQNWSGLNKKYVEKGDSRDNNK